MASGQERTPALSLSAAVAFNLLDMHFLSLPVIYALAMRYLRQGEYSSLHYHLIQFITSLCSVLFLHGTCFK